MSGCREGWLLLKHQEVWAEPRPNTWMQGSPRHGSGGQSKVLILEWVHSDEADHKGFKPGSGPGVITRVGHSPVILRQVHSDKGKVKMGYQTPGLGSGLTRPMARHRYGCGRATGRCSCGIAQVKTEEPDLSSNGMVKVPGESS